MRLTPDLREEDFEESPNTSTRTLAGIPDIQDITDHREDGSHSAGSGESLSSADPLSSATDPTRSTISQALSDDADSGVLSQSSTGTPFN